MTLKPRFLFIVACSVLAMNAPLHAQAQIANGPAFSTIDANGDGTITQDEMNAYIAARNAPVQYGVIAEGETRHRDIVVTAPVARGPYTPSPAQAAADAQLYNSFDTNGDGQISQSEYLRGTNRNGGVAPFGGTAVGR